MPIIFAHRWDKEKNDWMNVTPRLFDGYLSVLGSMDINSDLYKFLNSILSISFRVMRANKLKYELSSKFYNF